MNLQRFEAKYFSQNGEDGIIDAMTKFFDPPKTFLEIGSGDGLENNTRHLIEQRGWTGWWVDQGPVTLHDGAIMLLTRVTRDNIVPTLNDAGVDKRIGFLSLDIDGNDYHVLRSILMGGYRPYLMCLEYNPKFKMNEHWIMPYNPNHSWDCSYYYGASFLALAALCRDFGYYTIGANSTGTNMFLVRQPLLDECYVPKDEYLYRNHQESDRIKDVTVRTRLLEMI